MPQTKELMALSVAKINDGTRFEDNLISIPPSYYPKKKKVEYWGMHVETMKSQQVKVEKSNALCLGEQNFKMDA